MATKSTNKKVAAKKVAPKKPVIKKAVAKKQEPKPVKKVAPKTKPVVKAKAPVKPVVKAKAPIKKVAPKPVIKAKKATVKPVSKIKEVVKATPKPVVKAKAPVKPAPKAKVPVIKKIDIAKKEEKMVAKLKALEVKKETLPETKEPVVAPVEAPVVKVEAKPVVEATPEVVPAPFKKVVKPKENLKKILKQAKPLSKKPVTAEPKKIDNRDALGEDQGTPAVKETSTNTNDTETKTPEQNIQEAKAIAAAPIVTTEPETETEKAILAQLDALAREHNVTSPPAPKKEVVKKPEPISELSFTPDVDDDEEKAFAAHSEIMNANIAVHGEFTGIINKYFPQQNELIKGERDSGGVFTNCHFIIKGKIRIPPYGYYKIVVQN